MLSNVQSPWGLLLGHTVRLVRGIPALRRVRRSPRSDRYCFHEYYSSRATHLISEPMGFKLSTKAVPFFDFARQALTGVEQIGSCSAAMAVFHRGQSSERASGRRKREAASIPSGAGRKRFRESQASPEKRRFAAKLLARASLAQCATCCRKDSAYWEAWRMS